MTDDTNCRLAATTFTIALFISAFPAHAQEQEPVEQAATAPDEHQPDEHQAEEEEAEEIIVQATRNRRRVQDEPIRVEVVTREEIEEKLLMRPGNIALLVNETGGVRCKSHPEPSERRTSAFREWRAATRSCWPTGCHSMARPR